MAVSFLYLYLSLSFTRWTLAGQVSVGQPRHAPHTRLLSVRAVRAAIQPAMSLHITALKHATTTGNQEQI
jgi:hypothetical protein